MEFETSYQRLVRTGGVIGALLLLLVSSFGIFLGKGGMIYIVLCGCYVTIMMSLIDHTDGIRWRETGGVMFGIGLTIVGLAGFGLVNTINFTFDPANSLLLRTLTMSAASAVFILTFLSFQKARQELWGIPELGLGLAQIAVGIVQLVLTGGFIISLVKEFMNG